MTSKCSKEAKLRALASPVRRGFDWLDLGYKVLQALGCSLVVLICVLVAIYTDNVTARIFIIGLVVLAGLVPVLLARRRPNGSFPSLREARIDGAGRKINVGGFDVSDDDTRKLIEMILESKLHDGGSHPHLRIGMGQYFRVVVRDVWLAVVGSRSIQAIRVAALAVVAGLILQWLPIDLAAVVTHVVG